MLLFPNCLLTKRTGTSAGGMCALSALEGSSHATLNLKKMCLHTSFRRGMPGPWSVPPETAAQSARVSARVCALHSDPHPKAPDKNRR